MISLSWVFHLAGETCVEALRACAQTLRAATSEHGAPVNLASLRGREAFLERESLSTQ